MKNFSIFLFCIFSYKVFAVCASPISRTNNSPNTVLSSTKYNLDLNTLYNQVNDLPGDCIKDATIAGVKLQNSSINLAKLASDVLALVNPIGTILSYAGGTAPNGYLLCDGQAVSRTTFSALFAVIGTTFGNGNGTTTFNLPDLRGQFLRGRVNISTMNGTGTAALNLATFTAHGIIRTGFRVRLISGTLSGLTTNTDYFAIVSDDNTLGFATTYANAIADTRIAISGANSAVIAQFEDPDALARVESAKGGATTTALGSRQADALQGHGHTITTGRNDTFGSHAAGSAVGHIGIGGGVGFGGKANILENDGVNGDPRSSFETRVKNITVNFIIKT
jgi:microcystin-dependent protein